MKIKNVKAFPINIAPNPTSKPRVEEDPNSGYFASPMDRYATDRPGRNWTDNWARVACVVTADDGT